MRLLCWILPAIAFFPGALFAALVLLNAFNPHATMFKTEFWVENQTQAVLVVTPIGMTNPQGQRSALPVMTDTSLNWPAFQRDRFTLEPGASRKFVYDWDDIQLSELLVETGDNLRVLVIDANAHVGQFHPPTSTHFAISRLDALPSAPLHIVRVPDDTSSWSQIYVVISVLGTVWWLRQYWRLILRAHPRE